MLLLKTNRKPKKDKKFYKIKKLENKYKIYETETFTKLKEKVLLNSEIEKYNKKKEELKYRVYGDVLRFHFFREFRVGNGKRIYFLVYEEIKLILFVDISIKKYQDETIDKIVNLLPYFKYFAYELVKHD